MSQSFLNPKYKLIIFDCDGTLVNTESLLGSALEFALNKHGFKLVTQGNGTSKYTGLGEEDLRRALITDYEIDDTKATGILSDLKHRFKATMARRMTANIGAHQTLTEIAKVNKCVASNSTKPFVIEALRVTDLLRFFNSELIFTKELVKRMKPSPDIFLLAAENMGVEIERCLVIEDSVVGVKAAKAAGMDVLMLENPLLQKEEIMETLRPTEIIENLTGILKYKEQFTSS